MALFASENLPPTGTVSLNLEGLLSPDNATRKQAETDFRNVQQAQPALFAMELVTPLGNPQASSALRDLCAVMVRKEIPNMMASTLTTPVLQTDIRDAVKARLLELSRRSRGLEQTYSELSLSLADLSTKRRGAPAPPAARGYNRLSDAEAPAIAAAAAARPPAFGAAPAARPPAGKERTRTAATASAPPAVKPKRRYGLVPLSVRGFGGKKGKR